MNNIEALGWLSSLLLSACSLPQVIQILREGHAEGLSKGFLFMWAAGNLLTQVYIITKFGMVMSLLSKYWANDVFLCIMIKYKLFPKRPSLTTDKVNIEERL